MNLKMLALVAAAGTTLLAAAPAFANHEYRDSWRGSSHAWRAPQHRNHHYHPGNYRARGYYMPPPRVYYTPPAPYYYDYEPRPVIYGRIPLGHRSSIGFSLPLN